MRGGRAAFYGTIVSGTASMKIVHCSCCVVLTNGIQQSVRNIEGNCLTERCGQKPSARAQSHDCLWKFPLGCLSSISKAKACRNKSSCDVEALRIVVGVQLHHSIMKTNVCAFDIVELGVEIAVLHRISEVASRARS